eukprot:Nk52_evm12s914 gene=Nk52_evmTU12s914
MFLVGLSNFTDGGVPDDFERLRSKLMENVKDSPQFHFISSLISMVAVYYTFHRANLSKKNAWFLTLYCASVLTSFGLYFIMRTCLNYYNAGKSDGSPLAETLVHEMLDIINETSASLFICSFFMAYCLMDLVIGYFHYHTEIQFLSGWLHHTFYFVFLAYLSSQNKNDLFACCLLEELPTVALALTKVTNSRERFSYGLCFFLVRISFHTYVIYSLLRTSSIGLFLFGLIVLKQHFSWFKQWMVKKFHTAESSLSLKGKLYTLGAALTFQTISHTVFVYKMLMLEDEMITPSSLYVILHTTVLVYFTIEVLKVIQDVYFEHFINETITSEKIIYNISWEDPAIEREFFGISGKDSILTIASAGDNVLDYLIEGPKSIVAADLNKAQLHLLELKIVCLKQLTYDQFFAIFGKSDADVFKAVYRKTLRPCMSKGCGVFWDNNMHLFETNLMFCGTSGLLAKILSYPFALCGVPEYFRANYANDKAPNYVMMKPMIKLLQYSWQWLAPLGGCPPSQIDLVKRDGWVWAERLAEVVQTRMWSIENYFYYGYAVGSFSKTCCPRYLKEEHFSTLQKYCDRITLFHGTVAKASQLRTDFTLVSLLDSMDWLSFDTIASQTTTILPRMKRGGNIFWRSFSTKVHSPFLANMQPVKIHTYDRVGWYLSQWYVTKNEVNERVDSEILQMSAAPVEWTRSNFVSDLKVIATMVSFGLTSGTDGKESVREFYRTQAEAYDSFRESLLPGRSDLCRHIIPWSKTKIKTWVSVGCGTARDLEFVINQVRKLGTLIYLIDLSPELLSIARKRVANLHLTKQVSIIEGDICESQEYWKTLIPQFGQVDLVTCSYCLTMIPNWEKAANRMISMLGNGGSICIVDFTICEITGKDSIDQKFYKWWFAHDNVWLNEEHPSFFCDHPSLKKVWLSYDESRVPYTPFYPTRYMFSGTKQSKVANPEDHVPMYF